MIISEVLNMYPITWYNHKTAHLRESARTVLSRTMMKGTRTASTGTLLFVETALKSGSFVTRRARSSRFVYNLDCFDWKLKFSIYESLL